MSLIIKKIERKPTKSCSWFINNTIDYIMFTVSIKAVEVTNFCLNQPRILLLCLMLITFICCYWKLLISIIIERTACLLSPCRCYNSIRYRIYQTTILYQKIKPMQKEEYVNPKQFCFKFKKFFYSTSLRKIIA